MAKDGPIKVFYPSGGTLLIRGKWMGLAPVGSEQGVLILNPTQMVVKGMKPERFSPHSAWIGDPRGIYMYEDFVLYEPRRFGNVLPQWVRDWLEEHPEWSSE